MKHDQLRHLRNLRLLLSQDKSPLGFFIAAGCPRSIKDEKGNPLLPDMKELSLMLSTNHANDASNTPYMRLHEEMKKCEKNVENVEEVLTFIRSMKEVAAGGGIVRGFSESDLINLEKELCDTIASSVNKCLPDGDNSYRRLVKWVSAIDRSFPVEIFTTNYDLLIEQALEEQNVPFFDGFSGSRYPVFDIHSVQKNDIPSYWARLWKLHGSINWRFEGKNVCRVSMDIEGKVDGSPELIYPSKFKYDQSRKMPFLAMSDRLKSYLHQPHAVLIVCGYSFNDEHINDTIINALKVNPSANVIVMMFGKMPNENDKISTEVIRRAKDRPNLSVWYDDKAIIDAQEYEWTEYDESNKDFAGLSLNVVEKHVALGDFDAFTSFIYQLIGGHYDEDK